MTQKWQKSKSVSQCKMFYGSLIDLELQSNKYAEEHNLTIVSSSITHTQQDKFALSVVFTQTRHLEY